MSIKSTSLIAALLASSMLTGCASAFTVGNSGYSCPGLPDGVRCMSTRDVYAETNSKDSLKSNSSKKAQTEAPAISTDASVAATTPAVPTVKPVPVRTPAKVMRVWIAPWQDESDFLHGSEYVFAEVEGRKWSLGDGKVFPAGKKAGANKAENIQRIVTPLK